MGLGRTLFVVSTILALFWAFALPVLYQVYLASSGHAIKVLASSYFLSGRDPDTVVKDSLSWMPMRIFWEAGLYEFEVDDDKHEATLKLGYGLSFVKPRKVRCRANRGCVLFTSTNEEEHFAIHDKSELVHRAPRLTVEEDTEHAWPFGDGEAVRTNPRVDYAKLDKAFDWAFDEPNVDNGWWRRTRGVVVVVDGQLVGERYAPGFDKNTAQLGWSMTKSLMTTLIAMRIGDGKITLNDTGLHPVWRASENDPRLQITLDVLLRASTGLAYNEAYGPTDDCTRMLYGEDGDLATFAASFDLASKPGSEGSWAYSSGATNIASSYLRSTFANDDEYWSYPQRLFESLRMQTMTLETDSAGTFVGSSYAWGSPRDWARLGLLYLNGGKWGEEQIIPDWYATYATTPTETSVRREYGAQVWLNAGQNKNETNRKYERLSTDIYAFLGFEEQSVLVIPHKNAVVVRMGCSWPRTAWDVQEWALQVIESIRD